MGGKTQTTAARGERNSGKYISEKTEKRAFAHKFGRNVRDVRSSAGDHGKKNHHLQQVKSDQVKDAALLNVRVSWIN